MWYSDLMSKLMPKPSRAHIMKLDIHTRIMQGRRIEAPQIRCEYGCERLGEAWNSSNEHLHRLSGSHL